MTLRASRLPIMATIVVLSFVLVGCNKQQQQAADVLTNQNEATNQAVNAAPQPSGDTGVVDRTNDPSELKRFLINGKNFEFSVKEMRVKKGDRVRVQFTSTDGFHDWVVDEFDVATGRVNTGETTAVEFTVDKAGTFEYYCSVGQHRQMGMVGKLIVVE